MSNSRAKWLNQSSDRCNKFSSRFGNNSKRIPSHLKSEATNTTSRCLQVTQMKLYESDVHVTVQRDKCLIAKPTRCTNFSNLFLKSNFTCFGEFLYPSSGVFTVNTAMVYVIQVCRQLASRNRMDPFWSCSQAVCIPIRHIPLLCVQ